MSVPSDQSGLREGFEHIDHYNLLLERTDYGIFRRWANENRYGDSAYAFRKLLRLAGLLNAASDDQEGR